jgi:hypothetical protein
MKQDNTLPPSMPTSADKMGNHYKLASLLALAGGAVVMPQTGNADIIYTNLSSPVTVGYFNSPSYLINDLPGAAQLNFHLSQSGTGYTGRYSVTARSANNYVRLKTNAYATYHGGTLHIAARAVEGQRWNAIGSGSAAVATAGVATYSAVLPTTFNDRYYAFKFQDTSQGGLDCFGWIRVNLNNQTLGIGYGPHLTIYGWGYDDTGNPIPMGAIPEPSSGAILALGALTLGAKGLRHWRRNRAAAGGS